MSFDLEFSPPRLIEGGPYGPREVATAWPTDAFWAAWRGSKSSLKEAGYAVTKNADNRWVVHRTTIPQSNEPAPEVRGYKAKQIDGLYPYQVPHLNAVCAALIKHHGVLDASDTGTGKTFTAIAACREIGLTPAIVCPISVIRSWESVCKLFGIRPLFVTNWEACKSKKFSHGEFDERELYTWKLPQKLLLIFDEAHKAKGESTLNAKMVIAAKKQGQAMLLLSATIAASPREMRAMGYALGLHVLKDFGPWSQSFGCYQNRFNGWECADPKRAMRQISELIFPAKGARMRIAELGDAFPSCQVTAEAYEVKNANKQNREYEKLVAEISKLREAKKQNVQAAIMVLNLRYRQFAEMNKIDLLKEMISDHLENGLSVAVFVNFRDTLDTLTEAFKAVCIHGSQSIEERQAAIDAFQEDRAHVIIVNIKAGGAGISLHDVRGERSRIGLVCPTYSATELKQVLGRIHRAGAKSPAIYRLIYAAGTVEVDVCASVARKIQAISTLNDGDLMETNTLGFQTVDGEEN